MLQLQLSCSQGNHTPLPPAVLVAFLVVYAGFNLEGFRGDMRQRQQRRAAAVPGTTSSTNSSGRKSPGDGNKAQATSAKKAKQRKQA